MEQIKETKYQEIIAILDELDKGMEMPESPEIKEDSDLVKTIKNYFSDHRYKELAVLGIDIYRYSKYGEPEQFMVPVIFKYFYDKTVESCMRYEPYLFQDSTADKLSKDFIPTGDGGFQIFPTPLHAFIFSIYFETQLRFFNSFSTYPKLREYLGEIDLRYTLTYNKLFYFNQNYFGTAIINNSRILSKDNLNRFLIDGNTFDWFLRRLSGIESLAAIYLNAISELKEFQNYNVPNIGSNNSLLIPIENRQLLTPAATLVERPIRQINVQKIGLIKVKGTSIDVYSVFAQVFHKVGDAQKPLIVSLGNTNSKGI